MIVEEDRSGVRTAALVQASTCYGDDNSYVADAVKAFPERFAGVFSAARIAWGSNYPASERSLPDLLSLAQDTLAFLPDRDREWIFSLTAQTLYPSLAGHSRYR